MVAVASGSIRPSDHATFKYVRLVKFKFQARLRWGNGPDGDCSLGLYPSSHEAKQAVHAVAKFLNPSQPITLETVWAATQEAKRVQRVRPDILPKYVRAVPGGYVGRLAQRGRRWFTGVHDCPLAAHRAAVALRQQLQQSGQLRLKLFAAAMT